MNDTYAIVQLPSPTTVGSAGEGLGHSRQPKDLIN